MTRVERREFCSIREYQSDQPSTAPPRLRPHLDHFTAPKPSLQKPLDRSFHIRTPHAVLLGPRRPELPVTEGKGTEVEGEVVMAA